MKKVIILLTLFAFITAGAFAVNKVQAKVTKDVKIEMLKLSQDPVKAKEGDKTKKTDKPAVAPSATSATGQGNAPTPSAPKSNVKTNYPKAKKEACVSGAAKPAKK
jgi:uncharacterized protein YxeA